MRSWKIVLIAVLLAVAFTAPVAAASVERITNGNFSDKLNGWTIKNTKIGNPFHQGMVNINTFRGSVNWPIGSTKASISQTVNLQDVREIAFDAKGRSSVQVWAGRIVDTINVNEPGVSNLNRQYKHYTVKVPIQFQHGLVMVKFTNVGGSDLFIDNVSALANT